MYSYFLMSSMLHDTFKVILITRITATCLLKRNKALYVSEHLHPNWMQSVAFINKKKLNYTTI